MVSFDSRTWFRHKSNLVGLYPVQFVNWLIELWVNSGNINGSKLFGMAYKGSFMYENGNFFIKLRLLESDN